VLAIARELHIPKVIVPLFPAHFSALGMLWADERHDFIRTFYADLDAVDFTALARTLEDMVAESASALRSGKRAERRIQLDLRYVGQEFTLPVPASEKQIRAGDREAIRSAFDRLYERRYAHHSPGEPVEIVNVRLAVIGKRPAMKVPKLPARLRAKATHRAKVFLGDAARPVSCPVYRREELGAGARISGPALVREHGTTTVLFAGDRLTVAPTGELLISVRGAT
jgi:N-methylhydantoinase A